MNLYFVLSLFLFSSLPFPARGTHRIGLYQSKTTTNSGIIYRRVRIRHTGILFPRLVNFHDKAVMRQVNRQIDQLTEEFGCEERVRHSYYRVKSTVEYADKEIFSIYASAAYSCGGPYPTNDSNISVTFDLTTGKQVNFEELFTDYETNKRAILKIIFAQQVERAEKVNRSGRRPDGTCEGNGDLYSLDNLEGGAYSFAITKTGLNVQPQWPHVIEACAERVTVPYEMLKEYAARGGLLERVTE